VTVPDRALPGDVTAPPEPDGDVDAAAAVPETAVPPGETPAARCRHCGRPFPDEEGWALHVGEVHPEAVDAAEREAYEAADAAERDELFVYHMKVVVALGLLYSVGVLGYMVLATL
jgi:hypothetical protein